MAGGAGGQDGEAGHRGGGHLHLQALRQGQEGQVVHPQPGGTKCEAAFGVLDESCGPPILLSYSQKTGKKSQINSKQGCFQYNILKNFKYISLKHQYIFDESASFFKSFLQLFWVKS